MSLRWMMVVSGALLAGTGSVSAGDKTYIVRDLAGRVGPIIGSALACRDIARPRIQVIVDKFTAVITESSSNEAERSDLTQLLDRNVADGRSAVTTGRIDCVAADRQLADLERSIAPRSASPAPPASSIISPSSAVAATAPTAPVSVAAPPVRGITDREIKFGMAAAF